MGQVGLRQRRDDMLQIMSIHTPSSTLLGNVINMSNVCLSIDCWVQMQLTIPAKHRLVPDH